MKLTIKQQQLSLWQQLQQRNMSMIWFPTLCERINCIGRLKVVRQPLLFPRQQCDSIKAGPHRCRSYSNTSMTSHVRTILQPNIRNSCHILSMNVLSMFPGNEPKRLPQCHRSFHSTRYSPSEAAVATATDAPSSPSSVSTDETPPILWTTHRLKPEQIQKVDAVFHKILWLDLFEASMLNEIVNEKMGVSLTKKQRRQLTQLMEQRAQEAVGNMSSTGSNSEETVEVEAGPVLVDMKLASYDAASKIKVIKEVRSILNLGLKEAKEMVESAPVTLQKGMKPELAEELKTKLESVGAKIEIV